MLKRQVASIINGRFHIFNKYITMLFKILNDVS
jgi:hypothetical protein